MNNYENKEPTEYDYLLKDERTLLDDIDQAQALLNSLTEDLDEVRKKIAECKALN